MDEIILNAKYCKNCGAKLPEGAKYCSVCGCDVNSTEEERAEKEKVTSTKSRLATLLFCFFLGNLGVHRFYVGKTGTGIAMLLTAGGCGIWTIIDFVFIVIGSFTDSENKPITNW